MASRAPDRKPQAGGEKPTGAQWMPPAQIEFRPQNITTDNAGLWVLSRGHRALIEGFPFGLARLVNSSE